MNESRMLQEIFIAPVEGQPSWSACEEILNGAHHSYSRHRSGLEGCMCSVHDDTTVFSDENYPNRSTEKFVNFQITKNRTSFKDNFSCS